MNITKYKKLNMTEHKPDLNITKYKKAEHDGAQNWHTKYKNWTWRNTKQTWTLLKLINTKKK